MASILSGGASWTPAMAAFSLLRHQYSVGSSYFRDWDGMMLETEHVGDPLTACVSHEDSNATIGICSMQ
jgi:hypothetical protein